MTEQTRPAFYALAPGGWRDYLTLLHPPYTLWHLSYVVVGACLAPAWRPERLGPALAAFFLALGIGAHALDELQGRPLRTRIPAWALWGLAASSIAAAVTIGAVAATRWTPWLAPFVAFGGFIAVAYNLELFGGRFHTDAWFCLAWGAFPLLTGYFAAAEQVGIEAVTAAAGAALLSYAQRRLSAHVRTVRRQAVGVSGAVELHGGKALPVDRDLLTRAAEDALRALAAASVALALALVLVRMEDVGWP